MKDQTPTVSEFAPTKGILTASGLIIFCILAISTALCVWADSSLVSNIGFVLTAVGLGVSVLGFGFTIQQLQKTQTAASAASNAIARLRKDFGSIDLISELGAAKAAADEALEALQSRKWPNALLGFRRLHQSLSKIIAIDRGSLSQEMESIKDFTADSLGACGELQKEPGEDFDISILGGKLIEMSGKFTQIEYKIRGDFSGG